MLCVSERWKSKTKIEVAANVLGFPLLEKVDVTWPEGERRKMRSMERKEYDVVWVFESHNFPSFELGVAKENTCLFTRLWLGRIPKNRNIIENV